MNGDFFLIFPPKNALLVYTKALYSHVDFFPDTLVNGFVRSESFLIKSLLRSFQYSILLSVNNDNLIQI